MAGCAPRQMLIGEFDFTGPSTLHLNLPTLRFNSSLKVRQSSKPAQFGLSPERLGACTRDKPQAFKCRHIRDGPEQRSDRMKQ